MTDANILTLKQQDEQINKITAEIAKKKGLISQKIQEMRTSKKDNPLLEGIYNEYVSYIKKTNQSTIDALSNLHSYLADLDIPTEDLKERNNDLDKIKKELKKIRHPR
jgi:hypothetical protein